ncbi:MAG TPA: hypothetical protein VJ984_05745 [Xanthomonadales bacterium]|nr:hypothetical protein [Xanthomonadales bacterium]
MRILTLLNSLILLVFSTTVLAAPVNPLNCFCSFDAVLPDGMGLVDATECQFTEETGLVKERGERGAFSETLSFVGGAGQACATLRVRKFKNGNENMFGCSIWIQESTSDLEPNCMAANPRNLPVQNFSNISRRNMRACQRLLDDVAEQVDVLPDCRLP